MVTKKNDKTLSFNFSDDEVIDSLKQVKALRDFCKSLPDGGAEETAKALQTAIEAMMLVYAKLFSDEKGWVWLPVYEDDPDTFPPVDEDGYSEKILLSFSNADFVLIGEYRVDDGGGAFYEGDSEKSLLAEFGLIVNAWATLPKRYREEER